MKCRSCRRFKIQKVIKGTFIPFLHITHYIKRVSHLPTFYHALCTSYKIQNFVVTAYNFYLRNQIHTYILHKIRKGKSFGVPRLYIPHADGFPRKFYTFSPLFSFPCLYSIHLDSRVPNLHKCYAFI